MSWARLADPTRHNEPALLADLRFLTAEIGYVVGPTHYAPEHLYRSNDGGRSWQTIRIGQPGEPCGGTRLSNPDIDGKVDLDDDLLWRDVRKGNADALAALFRRHAHAIYNYCFRRLGDWSAAEDSVSIVFLEAWRRRDVEIEPGKVLPWLYGVATNVLRNRGRSERRYAAALRRVPPERPTPDPADDAVARADDERRMCHLLELVAGLSHREQDVLALCAWSELSYDDAASALGIPIGTVRSRLSRARKRLRELDADFGHEADTAPHHEEVPEQ